MSTPAPIILEFTCPICGQPGNRKKWDGYWIGPPRQTLYKRVKKARCWGCNKWYQFDGVKWIEIPKPERKSRALDLTGKRFGRWVCIRLEEGNHPYLRRWICKCDCGVERSVPQGPLVNGGSKSCGCLSKYLKNQQRKKARAERAKRFVSIAESLGIGCEAASDLYRRLARSKIVK